MPLLLRVAALLWLAALFPAVAAEPLELSSRQVPLNSEDRGVTRVGGLIWRGGLEISSRHPRFGGLSGLLVSPDGKAMIAVTDEGRGITARLAYDREGRLAGVSDGRIAPLTGLDGKPLKGKRHQDAESLAALADGALLVSFEHKHRIRRYPRSAPPFTRPPKAVVQPPGLAALPSNKGIEALTALADGRLLAITQGRDRDPDIAAFLWQDGHWSRLGYEKHGAFLPTGAALLPGGDVIVLERRFTWLGGVAARLVRLESDDIRPAAALAGREVAELRPPFSVDNMEGIDARRGAGGETLIYLISDDNFHALQRTLLLMFTLEE